MDRDAAWGRLVASLGWTTVRSGRSTAASAGLTVARALIDLLPNEHLVYLGDTGRYPYGPRAAW